MARKNIWDSNTLPLSLQDLESPDLTLSHRSLVSTPAMTSHSGMSDDISWSPPAWRKAGTGWFRPYSPDEDEEEEDDSSLAAEIPLPSSPVKGRSVSPEPEPEPVSVVVPDEKSYIRFSVRADVQQRTEPIEAVLAHVRRLNLRSILTTSLALLSSVYILRALLQVPEVGPAPDLIKVAGLAKSFEPLMYYSEHGHNQVVQLGDTGVAVWDLGESVRQSNMTSGPIIVQSLDDLAEQLKSLALELTRFFAHIDGDIDSILIVMEWAQRELTRIATLPSSQLSVVFGNLHALFARIGVLESAGEQTAVGRLVQELFGQTTPQVTRNTLQRTFTEFLSVLEESIHNELRASIGLFAHFEAIDRQFLNLQRTVVRESDAQERQENEILSSLWSRVIGADAGRLKKFEKNKTLLSSLRDRTVQNKHVLVDHNSRLLQLRSNLDVLRQKLVSPLVRSRNSSTLTIDEQIQGLQGTYTSLKDTRDGQKTRLYALLHDAGGPTRRRVEAA